MLKQLMHYLKSIHPVVGLVLIAYIISLCISITIPSNRIFLAGEYMYSLDYPGIIQSILDSFRENPSSLFQNTSCEDCPDIYGYSRWYTLIKFSILNLNTYLLLNPFIGYLFISFAIQATALYFYTKLLVKKFNFIPYFIALLVFAYIPYKYSLYASGSLYSFHHSFFLGYITLLFYLFQNIKHLHTKKILLISSLLGLITSFFLNISINYFPILFYFTAGLIILKIKNILENKLKWFLVAVITASITLLVNIPMVVSIVKSETIYTFNYFVSLNTINAFSMQWFLSHGSKLSAVLFFGTILLLLVLSRLHIKLKIALVGLYILTALILLGDNSPLKLYRFIFEHIPLMDSIRSLHRFIFFEIIIVVTIVYTGLSSLNKNSFKDFLFKAYISGVILILISSHIYSQRHLFFTADIPHEYASAAEYLNSLDGEKVYFPAYVPYHQSIPNHYSWSDKNYYNSNVYFKNPFTSIYPIKNLIQFEKYPSISPDYQSIRFSINYSLEPKEVLDRLRYQDVQYIILDNNYYWKNNFSNFDTQFIIDNTSHIKQFGNILILEIKNRQNCQETYGDLPKGFCYNDNYPKHLTDRTELEYLIETNKFVPKNSFTKSQSAQSNKIIIDVSTQEQIIKNSVLIPESAIFFLNSDQEIYSANLDKGKYIIAFMIFENENNENMVTIHNDKNNVDIKVNNSGTFKWYFSEIENQDRGKLDLKISNDTTFGIEPLIFTVEEWEQLKKIKDTNSYKPVAITYE